MENSISETEVNQSLKSPPRRRRSTFFERRDSIVTQPVTDNKENFPKSNKQVEDLTCYYNELVFEKEQWKKEVKDRRNKYHDLREQYQISSAAASGRSRLSYSVLSNEDIEFLKAKPNLRTLLDKQQELHKSLRKTMALVQRKNELDDVVLDYCDQKVNQITEYIMENSSVPVD